MNDEGEQPLALPGSANYADKHNVVSFIKKQTQHKLNF